ncbi:FMN-dependent dehydrogenase [Colletotrichum camelliae]|nr:FMN-dependent dehydrogenase [Colletotrichum camelliae]
MLISRSSRCDLSLAGAAVSARPFLNEPSTGINEVFGDLPAGELPPLGRLVGLPDFDWAARHYLNAASYMFYRNGAADEFSHRNNLEGFHASSLVPVSWWTSPKSSQQCRLPSTAITFLRLSTSTPVAAPVWDMPTANLVLSVVSDRKAPTISWPSGLITRSGEDIANTRVDGQATFQQVYLEHNHSATQEIFDRVKALGHKALVFTVGSAAVGTRHRAARYGIGFADTALTYNTWDYYKYLQPMTDLPIIIKGVSTVEYTKLAVDHGAPGVILGPENFSQTGVFADGGVWYGADVLKLLALGVKAVGLGRPFMFANAYGAENVVRAAQLLKHEIAIDAANLGVADLEQINSSFVSPLLDAV